MMLRAATLAGLALVAAYLWAARPVLEDVFEDMMPQGPDPLFLQDQAWLDEAISRPALVPDAKGIVLLVHGTGMTPQVNWDHTLLQPLVAQSYQPYYLEVPNRLFHDTQITAEFISNAVKKISKEHDDNPGISVISWSAGSLATQWTLTFYPETRAKVKQHIALGSSYRGSWLMVPLVWLGKHTPDTVQQLPWSNFLATLRRFDGGRAIVPTTTIGSSTDQIVQPGFYGEGYADSWRLVGPLARNIDLFRVCASRRMEQWWLPRVITHQSLLWEPASHKIIFDALENEETYLGTADVVGTGDCEGGLAPNLEEGSGEKQAAIMPELFKHAPMQPVSGWPEVPLREYAQ